MRGLRVTQVLLQKVVRSVVLFVVMLLVLLLVVRWLELLVWVLLMLMLMLVWVLELRLMMVLMLVLGGVEGHVPLVALRQMTGMAGLGGTMERKVALVVGGVGGGGGGGGCCHVRVVVEVGLRQMDTGAIVTLACWVSAASTFLVCRLCGRVLLGYRTHMTISKLGQVVGNIYSTSTKREGKVLVFSYGERDQKHICSRVS